MCVGLVEFPVCFPIHPPHPQCLWACFCVFVFFPLHIRLCIIILPFFAAPTLLSYMYLTLNGLSGISHEENRNSSIFRQCRRRQAIETLKIIAEKNVDEDNEQQTKHYKLILNGRTVSSKALIIAHVFTTPAPTHSTNVWKWMYFMRSLHITLWTI